MSDFADWVMHGDDEFCPVEIHDDGTADIVLGLTLITSLDEMKQRAERIFSVDDLYDPQDIRLVYQRAGEPRSQTR